MLRSMGGADKRAKSIMINKSSRTKFSTEMRERERYAIQNSALDAYMRGRPGGQEFANYVATYMPEAVDSHHMFNELLNY
jgi:hypothetical protein